MNRYAVLIALAFVAATTPGQAQLLKKLEQGLLGGQQQNMGQQGYVQGIGQGMPGQPGIMQQGNMQQGAVQPGLGLLGQPNSMNSQQQGGIMSQIGGLLGQGQIQGQGSTLIGNVSLPPAQYMMTNVQTGQAFYVTVQNSQLFLNSQPMGQGTGQVMPGQIPAGQMMQQGGLGGLMQNGLGNFLKNELAPQQQQSLPNQ
jgi:hypothetical protein